MRIDKVQIHTAFLLTSLLSLLHTQPILSDPIINFFFKPLSLLEETDKAREFISRWSEPGKLERHRLRFAAERALVGQHIGGIPCLYAGFIAFSSNTGQVTFPRVQASPDLFILVTPNIEPVMMQTAVVHHFRVPQNTPMALYQLTQPEYLNQGSTSKETWLVKRANPDASFEEGKKIADNTIVVIASPKNIVFPEGTIATTKSPHLLLPNIFVRKTIDTVRNALYIINFTNFFRNVHPYQKISSKLRVSQIPPVQ